ncbi:MAG: 2-phospho-L-lactate guanylyltransferase [Actinomycetota bacterium]|nr:2-phospho-L-lactate guanylyltransferase [Actinomycetota bacterium]
MPTLIVPFRGQGAKRRLEEAPGGAETRTALAQAMLEDVVAACRDVGRTIVVTPDPLGLAVETLPDPGRGQGAAVAAALATLAEEPVLVVNADLPCATPRDLLALLGAVPPEGLALVAAEDGTTNALALSSPTVFEPVYGPGSAERFRRLAPASVADIPNLAADVDTIWDLVRLRDRVGPSTRAVLDSTPLAVG